MCKPNFTVNNGKWFWQEWENRCWFQNQPLWLVSLSFHIAENFATEQTPLESNACKIKIILLHFCSLKFSGNNCLSVLSGSKLAIIRLDKLLWIICRFILFMFLFRVSSVQMVYTDGTVYFLRNSQHKRRMLNKFQNWKSLHTYCRMSLLCPYSVW